MEKQQYRWELRDRMFSEDRMYDFVKRTAEENGFSQTLLALPAMKKYHEGQTRKGSGQIPYIYHPLTAACHALALDVKEDELLAAILLHDVCEDCGVAPYELPVNKNVQRIVEKVTFQKLPRESREEAKERYYKNIVHDREAMFVKILDRCNNISTMATAFDLKHMAAYIDETEKYILPLINVLKTSYPEFYNASFLLKYQMLSILESLKRIMYSLDR